VVVANQLNHRVRLSAHRERDAAASQRGGSYTRAMSSDLDEAAFRESVFAWLRARLLTTEGLTLDELSEFTFNGRRHRLVEPQTGIWRVRTSEAVAEARAPQLLGRS
jgi:hypothetical protein